LLIKKSYSLFQKLNKFKNPWAHEYPWILQYPRVSI